MGRIIAKWTLISLLCLGTLSRITEGRVLWVGETGEVECRVDGTPIAVGFSQGTSQLNQLVQWSPEQGVTRPGGERYDMMAESDGTLYTMIINDVVLSDADTYTCFWSHTSGSFQVNRTDVKVFDAPNEPFPTVQQCPPMPPPSQGSGDGVNHCMINLVNKTDKLNLTCSASGFYPNATLVWMVAGSERAPVAESWTLNSDGTANVEVTIEAEVSSNSYMCTISGLPIKGESKSFKVMVQVPEVKSTTISPTTAEDKDPGGGGGGGSSSVGLWVGIALAVVVLIVVVVVVIYKLWPRISESFSPQQGAF